MFIKNGNRFNIDIPYADPETGVKGIRLDNPEIRSRYGIQEIEEPKAPEDYSSLTYFRFEIDYAPYVVYEKKSDEMVQQALKAIATTEALDYLNKTDWYFIRQLDSGEAIPEEVVSKRMEARKVLNS